MQTTRRPSEQSPGDPALFPVDPRAPQAGALDVAYHWDLQTDEVTWSPGYEALAGLPPVAAVTTGLGYAEHLAAESPSSRYEAVMAPGGCDMGEGVPFTAIYGLLGAKRAKAKPVWIEDYGRWYADVHDRPSRVRGVIRVITERYEAERLQMAALQRDPLTGAYTKAHFVDHLARKLNFASRKTSSLAILLINIEQKGTAEPVSDEQLVEAVARLRSQMRSHEALARYAGAKLAALLEAGADDHLAAATRLIAAVGEVQPGRLPLVAHIGVVIAPLQGRTPHALLQFAEEALEAAYSPSSTEACAIYQPDLARAVARSGVASSDEIVAALDDGRIALALQPVVDARTRAVAFHEGLVRVKRADGSLILPDALVPQAEKRGLVSLIDRRVVEIAFALLTGDRKLVLAINASVPSLSDPGWLSQLQTCCRLRPDAARRLTIEVTETCAIADLEATRATLASIKPLGVKIAIDDFGSGHSSFRNLRQLPIDYLKIDGAFAQNLAESQDDRFFIRTLIDLARNLQIPTVAEWVEDEATAQILTAWGVAYLQGHLFGKAELAQIPTAARRSR